MPEAIAAPPTAEAPSNPALNNAFSILDGMDHGGDGPQPEPKRTETPDEKKAEKPAEKPADKITEKPADKPLEVGDEEADENKPAADKTAADKPAETAKEAVKAPPKLGSWAWGREQEKLVQQASAERDALRKEVETLKAKPATPVDDPEKKQLSERLQELEDHIRYVDYTKSKEYVEQYQKPYEETAGAAVARATQLKITQEDGTKRNLTADEFWKIVHIGDEDEAIAAAEQLFGEGSTKTSAVIERRHEIIKAHTAAEQAKERYKTEGAERSKKSQEQWEAQQRQGSEQTAARAARFKEMSELGEKHEKMKDVFVASEGDTEGSEMLAKYRHETDRAFAGGAQLKEGDEAWDGETLLRKHSVIRNRAGAFPYTVRQLRNTQKKVAELEAKIAGYQKSVPGDGAVRGDEVVTGESHPLRRALMGLPEE